MVAKYYEIKLETILNKVTKCYSKVYTINSIPDGVLSSIVTSIKREKLSEFSYNNNTCINIFLNPEQKDHYLQEQELPLLMTFLIQNGYTIETKLTELMQKKYFNLIFYISQN